jgi:thymidylate kinase
LQREFDRIERKGDGYHKRVREGFLELSKGHDGFVVVDAADKIETVHKSIIEIVKKI